METVQRKFYGSWRMRRSWRYEEWRDEERRGCPRIRCAYTGPPSPFCANQVSLDGYGSCMRAKQKLILFSVALDLVSEVPEHRKVTNK